MITPNVGRALSRWEASRSRKAAAEKAAQLATQVIEKKIDKSQPVEEQKTRKRKLINGPSEFRDIRRDQPQLKR